MNKKIVITVSCAISALIIFSACGKNEKDLVSNKETTVQNEIVQQSETVPSGYHVHVDENGETYTHADGEDPAEEAETNEDGDTVISNGDAIEIIKGFSAKKLGLEGEKEDYSFLASTEKKEIEGEEYIEVIAAVMTESDEDDTVSIDTKGTYYISEDGKKCLIKDLETGKTKELE